jgi:hypothetical protein
MWAKMHIDNDCVVVVLSISKDCAIYILDVWYHSSWYTAASGRRWLSPTLRSQAVVYLTVEQWTVSPNSPLLLSYGYLPMVALCCLCLPCATCYCILAKNTLFIYHDLVSLARQIIYPSIHSFILWALSSLIYLQTHPESQHWHMIHVSIKEHLTIQPQAVTHSWGIFATFPPRSEVVRWE